MALLPHRLYSWTHQLGNTTTYTVSITTFASSGKYANWLHVYLNVSLPLFFLKRAPINFALKKSRKSEMTAERNSTFMKRGGL